MMIDQIKLLLGEGGDALDKKTIHAAITLASQHYMRFRPSSPEVEASQRAKSWIMEYAMAHCKLVLAETACRNHSSNGMELVTVALHMMTSLETELGNFA